MLDPAASPAAPRSDGGPDLRRSILDETRHLLVTEGYTGLSMRKIARAAGCSATSIYLHFDSKDALTHALIEEGMDQLYRALDAAAGSIEDPRERLAALCHAYVRFGLERPEYYQVMFQLHPERMARYPVESYRRARRNVELFGTALAEAEAGGSVRTTHGSRVASTALWASLHGLVSLHLAERIDRRVAGTAFLDAAIDQALVPFGGGPGLRE